MKFVSLLSPGYDICHYLQDHFMILVPSVKKVLLSYYPYCVAIKMVSMPVDDFFTAANNEGVIPGFL